MSASGPLMLSELDAVPGITLGGSTGAKLCRDRVNGALHVFKAGNSPAHLLSELVANALYRAAGARVPDVRIVLGDQGASVGQLTAFITNGVSLRVLPPASRAVAEASLREFFLVDCLLGNWDVVKGDNVMVLPDDPANPIRLDNGGALFFRAQGGPKDLASADVPELDSMRDRSTSPSGAAVFGSLTDDDLRRQFARLNDSGAFRRIVQAAPTALLRDVLSGRVASIAMRFGAQTSHKSRSAGSARHVKPNAESRVQHRSQRSQRSQRKLI